MTTRFAQRMDKLEHKMNATGRTMYVTEASDGVDPASVLRELGITPSPGDQHVHLRRLTVECAPRLISTHPL